MSKTGRKCVDRTGRQFCSDTVGRVLYLLAIVILFLYPLRHIHMGADLWDAGYNYANFRFPGPEHMDTMWLFATWLANLLGSLLIRLPFGDTMLGMNFYTGLLVSMMAVAGFVVLTRRLKLPALPVFAGELIAVSLCWAPTAILYNYLTYLLLFAGTLLLYYGLIADKNGYLVLAGAVLGCNISVRFSNLVQTALILAVWGYAVIRKKRMGKVIRETGFCILGYAGVFVVYLILMSCLYGWKEYVTGISRLFGMTQTASDYAPSSMLAAVFNAYYENTYWLKRFALILAGGLIIALPIWLWSRLRSAPTLQKHKQLFLFTAFTKLLITLLTAAGAVWLYHKGLGYGDYAVYQAVFDPGVLVLTVILLFSLYLLLRRSTEGEVKLQALLVMITILITPLGSNNAVYSGINNLFLVLPWFLGRLWCFVKAQKEITYYPFQCVMAATVLILLVQSLRFGTVFVYEEATGIHGEVTEIEGVPVLEEIRTTPVKAEALTGLYEYLQYSGAKERTCLLYGQIPGVAYYMELAPAMNIWSDLRSYSYEQMEADLSALSSRVTAGIQSKPVVILKAELLQYWTADITAEQKAGLFYEPTAETKLQLLERFLKCQEYKLSYTNELFAVLE